MQADEVLRPFAGLRQSGDRQRRGVRCKDGGLGQHRFGLPGDVGLDGAVLEYRFDDQVTALEIVIDRGRLDPREQLLLALDRARSEEHTSELQSLMRNSYAV